MVFSHVACGWFFLPDDGLVWPPLWVLYLLYIFNILSLFLLLFFLLFFLNCIFVFGYLCSELKIVWGKSKSVLSHLRSGSTHKFNLCPIHLAKYFYAIVLRDVAQTFPPRALLFSFLFWILVIYCSCIFLFRVGNSLNINSWPKKKFNPLGRVRADRHTCAVRHTKNNGKLF